MYAIFGLFFIGFLHKNLDLYGPSAMEPVFGKLSNACLILSLIIKCFIYISEKLISIGETDNHQKRYKLKKNIILNECKFLKKS